jgi:hypothetical protein
MKPSKQRLLVAAWIVAGAAGALLVAWGYPRAAPFQPRHWRIDKGQAIRLAGERLRDLGPPVKHPYLVARLDDNPLLERLLQLALGHASLEQLRQTGLPDRVTVWEVFVYPPEALHDDWDYRAQISPSGEVLALQLHLQPQERGATITQRQARDRADAFLLAQGIDLHRYAEPELRSQQLAARTDLTLRYRDRHGIPGSHGSHGLEVKFAGDRLAGFEPWIDEPQERELQGGLRTSLFVGYGRGVVIYLFVIVLAVPFLRRYHEGLIGVRRGVQVFLTVLAAGLFLILMIARPVSQGVGFGLATREQTTLVTVIFAAIFVLLPAALLAFFSWSVGESICRERWGHKLAAFDALFQRQWRNATVARSSLIGLLAGLATAGALIVLFLALERQGVWPLVAGAHVSGAWGGPELVTTFVAFAAPLHMAVVLYVLPVLVGRLGKALGAAASVAVGGLAIGVPALPPSLGWAYLTAAAFACAPVFLFLAYDLLAVLVAGLTAYVVLVGYPLLAAANPSLQVQGWLALACAAAPLLASARYLGSRREFSYRYEDVPPHVRRIAERERQRVELETARRIQSSILPDLPPALAGVSLAHAYLPATEVGGDFYDVLALEDGRLAVAVGDVAGHGVSSGLVMSMAKSALAVQVTFNPEVGAVFETLNRMVYQTARKRLLATLCYALLDPARGELLFASAGHLYPYRISAAGKVDGLGSAGCYPLGVRRSLQIQQRAAHLEPGDLLFLFSDGLVEARREASDEPFGFERLEQSLARHAAAGVEGLRDGILEDVEEFTAHAPREDDQTILVLQLPTN